MKTRVTQIVSAIEEFPGTKIISSFEIQSTIIFGVITMQIDQVILRFEVHVLPQYPFQLHNTETIRFVNIELVECNHVNGDGSICVHTTHHPVLREKIHLDLNGLKHWITNYYIKKNADIHYEHILIDHQPFKGVNNVFLFTDTEHVFTNGEFGWFFFTPWSKASQDKTEIHTHLIQSFKIKKLTFDCKWSEAYKKKENNEGIFFYSETAPVSKERFAVKNFNELNSFFSQDFLLFIEKEVKPAYEYTGGYIPLLIGYAIPDAETHWQVILIPTGQFPNRGQKVLGTKKWIGVLVDQPIIWVQTKNCSYPYFFGRGAFDNKLTNAKILIIGIGAIGSMIATTLTRCGCKDISLIDYDTKEPENVCRSEYQFASGINLKVNELSFILAAISPFVRVSISEHLTDVLKGAKNDKDQTWLNKIQDEFNKYDIIFDCTTDNDIAYLLGSFNLNPEIFTISVTNGAKQLVCATKENLYHWLKEIFHQLKDEEQNMYNPAGCRSPTFRASYNDLAVLLQYALKHINNCFKQSSPIRHFYLSYDQEDMNIKITQF